jgi:hypothetical protein
MLGASSIAPSKMAPWPRHRPVHRLKARSQRVSVGTGASITAMPGAACCHGVLPHAAPSEPFRPVHLSPCTRCLLEDVAVIGSDAAIERLPWPVVGQFASIRGIRTHQCARRFTRSEDFLCRLSKRTANQKCQDVTQPNPKNKCPMGA